MRIGDKKKSAASGEPINLHKKRLKIGNLMMEVVKGDITEETTDVIVNSTNESLALHGGSHFNSLVIIVWTFLLQLNTNWL